MYVRPPPMKRRWCRRTTAAKGNSAANFTVTMTRSFQLIRDADSILLFGPGEAKGELKKRLEKDKLGARIEAVETEDAMTDRQIAAKVREYFHKKVG